MHDVHSPSDHHDVITRLYAEEIITAFRDQMKEAERLAEELHNVLKSCEAIVGEEADPAQIQTLAHWAEEYNSGLSVAGKISRDGNVWLRKLSQRLNTRIQEPLQIEAKNAVSPPPAIQPEHLGAAQQIGKMIPLSVVEHIWGRFPVRTARTGDARV